MAVDLNEMMPAGDASVEARISRERLIRKIQLGEVAGQKIAGVWHVERDSLREFIQRESTAK